ncbi:bacteriocin [Prochlorococcus sp. MIT 1201]|uniref:bacteriocin n=1 Tax=Prochlorococcus sp. MIT 1201 TaxID=3082535 RepID=UPI0039A75780
MTEPNNTSEEINEELSTDELKNVSGGIVIRGNDTMLRGNGPSKWGEICDVGASLRNPQGSGSGMTKADFERANKTGVGGEYYNE